MNSSGQNPATTGDGDAWFTTTRWGIVLDARSEDGDGSAAALAELCQIYWRPLYSFLRRSGRTPDEAQDLTQEFFSRLLAKNYLKSVVPERGKFRSFLLTAFNHFLANEWDRVNRQKRGGGIPHVSLDAQDTENRYLAEPVDTMSPEKAFERRWAMTLVDQTLARLGAEFSARDQTELFEQLKSVLSGETEHFSYAKIADKFNITVVNVKVTVHRLRQRFRELLREEIAQTVSSPQDVDDEVRYLFATLS
jgi:RNA polymerase sigma-70 factor (ECF subfamily)